MGDSHRKFVSYIDKSREFYAAQGYDKPYRWARPGNTPFMPLGKPLAEARVGVVTTARLPDGEPDVTYAAPATPQPSKMATEHTSWHKTATNTDDVGSFLPLDHLADLVAQDVLGSLNDRFYGIPTLYSERQTKRHASDIGDWSIDDGIDLLLLVPL